MSSKRDVDERRKRLSDKYGVVFSKLDDELAGEEKNRGIKPLKVSTPQVEEAESSKKKLMRIEPYGSFKMIAGEKSSPMTAQKPPEVRLGGVDVVKGEGEYRVTDAITSAKEMVERGVDAKERVKVITYDSEGKPVQNTLTVNQLAGLGKNEKLFKTLNDHGGWIKFGGDGGSDGTPDARVDEAIRGQLFNLAGAIAEKADEHPERIQRYGGVVKDIVEKALMPSYDDVVRRAFGGGGDIDLMSPNRGPMWYQLDETSRIAAIWYMDNIKWRGQYSIVGEYVSRQWSVKKHWKKKKKKKDYDLEKVLDIWALDVKDVFDLKDTGEKFKETKFKPPMKYYESIIKLMKTAGYFEVAKAVEKAKT